MKCPKCVGLGLRSTVSANGGTFVTAMGDHRYYDEDGQPHIHDPNTATTGYHCSEGHVFVVRRELPCPCASCPEGKSGACDLVPSLQWAAQRCARISTAILRYHADV